MVNDDEQVLDIYKIDTKAKIDKRKVLFVVLIILTIILIFLTINQIVKTVRNYKVYKQYEEQINLIKQQEEEEQVRIAEEKERIRQERIPKLTQTGKDNINNIYSSKTKRVFLTFDDGPSSVTPEILDILKKHDVKATFFVLGANVNARPDTVKKIYEEGHYIANHGYTHVYSSIYSSPQAVLDEFNQCNNAVKNAIGVPEYNSHLFRFPGGLVGGPYATIKSEAKELLNENEILQVDWNALSGDSETTKPTVEFLLNRVYETVNRKKQCYNFNA